MKIFDYIEEMEKENKEREKNNELYNYKKTLINFYIKSNECNNNLLEYLIGDKFNLSSIDTKNDKIRLNYIKPFNFEVLIDKNKFNQIKSFNECREISITNYEFSSDDLNFLNNGSLFYLSRLNLNLNENVNHCLLFIDFLLLIK